MSIHKFQKIYSGGGGEGGKGGQEAVGEADGLKLFGMLIGSCKGAATIYLFTMFEGGACQLKI